MATITLHQPNVNKIERTAPKPKLPASSLVNRLPPTDKELLSGLIAESYEYIDHPDFAKPDIEKTLFGDSDKDDLELEPSLPRRRSGLDGNRANATMPTFSYEQEARLFMRYNYARRKVIQILRGYVDQRLTSAATRELLRWARRAAGARCLIVRLNFPLVMAMAKRSRLNSMDFADMLSEGNLALLRSVEKFDCARGFKFSTYSCRAILKSFSRVAMRASRYRGQFRTEFDTANERSDHIERQRIDVEQDCVEELKQILIRNLAGLSEIERRVIIERFAVGQHLLGMTNKPKTLEQVGDMMGVTKERVRQIQNKALKKIRIALEVRYLAA